MSDSPSSQSAADAIHILVVEDDHFVRQILEMHLHNEGYQVTLARDGQEMRAAMEAKPADLVLMDLRLPGEDGFVLTRYLRAHYEVGIIILTTRHETVDRVVGLECGADDYVTKPFEERELVARIRSVLRRTTAPKTAADKPQRLGLHGCTFDEAMCTFRPPNGTEVILTTNESRLLGHLLRNSSHVQSREALSAAVLQRDWDPLDRSIDVLITRLRHKIETDPKRPAIIKTVRGTGYVVTPEVSGADSAA